MSGTTVATTLSILASPAMAAAVLVSNRDDGVAVAGAVATPGAGVAPGVGVGLTVMVGLACGVGDSVPMGVGEGVTGAVPAPGVGEGKAVGVAVTVVVADAVAEGVAVGDGDTVIEGVGDGVGVAVGVTVAASEDVPPAICPGIAPPATGRYRAKSARLKTGPAGSKPFFGTGGGSCTRSGTVAPVAAAAGNGGGKMSEAARSRFSTANQDRNLRETGPTIANLQRWNIRTLSGTA
ncbi:MAG: hypothetical protein HY673_19715 [Chloroflexi bacterium]|nr:hypothetical protein [Chloroflexota bacterium]